MGITIKIWIIMTTAMIPIDNYDLYDNRNKQNNDIHDGNNVGNPMP